jgi:hypothetical protein
MEKLPPRAARVSDKKERIPGKSMPIRNYLLCPHVIVLLPLEVCRERTKYIKYINKTKKILTFFVRDGKSASARQPILAYVAVFGEKLLPNILQNLDLYDVCHIDLIRLGTNIRRGEHGHSVTFQNRIPNFSDFLEFGMFWCFWCFL